MSQLKLYRCSHCGKIVEIIGGCTSCPTICCGEPMKELTANTTDAALEKHVPSVTFEGDEVRVQVGSTLHPMTKEHFIEFVILETDKGVRRVNFTPESQPIVTFNVKGEKPLRVYEHCNLHGLWVKEL